MDPFRFGQAKTGETFPAFSHRIRGHHEIAHIAARSSVPRRQPPQTASPVPFRNDLRAPPPDEGSKGDLLGVARLPHSQGLGAALAFPSTKKWHGPRGLCETPAFHYLVTEPPGFATLGKVQDGAAFEIPPAPTRWYRVGGVLPFSRIPGLKPILKSHDPGKIKNGL